MHDGRRRARPGNSERRLLAALGDENNDGSDGSGDDATSSDYLFVFLEEVHRAVPIKVLRRAGLPKRARHLLASGEVGGGGPSFPQVGVGGAG